MGFTGHIPYKLHAYIETPQNYVEYDYLPHDNVFGNHYLLT